jgi:hypothetical protein
MKSPALACPAEMRGSLWTTKDLARYMALSPRRVKCWWKRLRVPPDACRGNACHRWSWRAVCRLLKKWQAYWEAHGMTPESAGEKFSGKVKREREQRQLQFKFR